MGVCSCCSPEEDKKHTNFKKGEANDISNGPVKERHCTDIICCFVFILAILVYFVISFMGIADGSLSKLYSPRDFSGAYCGSEENWNSNLNLKDVPKLSYTMNVSRTVDEIAKQMMCSSAAKNVLSTSLSSTEYETYLCECCLSQCAKCDGSLELGGDLDTSQNLQETIRSRITAVTTDSVSDMYNPAGSNGDTFGNMWSSATQYLIQVCVDSCDTNYKSNRPRRYDWEPSGDSLLLPAWKKLQSSSDTLIADTIAEFSFKALPESQCPYEARYCVPFPGVTFKEMDVGEWCQLEMADDVVSVVGNAAASYASLGNTAISDASSESLGDLMGDLQESLPATIIVFVVAFVVGFVFLVLMRFFLGICVWLSIFLVLLFFAIAGGIAYVYSFQCSGATLFDTGKTAAVAVTAVGTAAVDSAASGDFTWNEDMDADGDGADYRGRQMVTKDGKTCQAWGTTEPHAAAGAYTKTKYPSLEANYCRNPYVAGDVIKGNTIWCFTTDSDQIWDECLPLGTFTTGGCEDGYAVTAEWLREACKILAYVIWILGGIFLIVIICKCRSIKDAIAVNQTACLFMMDTPMIWVVPCVQVLISFCWLLIWIPLAGLLLSQVPDDYTPTAWYATYAEAAGTVDTPGACTDSWPTGFVWKDEACVAQDGVVKCWRCSPPRYVLDWRSFYSIFMLLWNNAFFIACGQCVIAGAVCVWFFATEKSRVPCVRQAVWHVVRYHMGSLAFGSFILAVVQFLKLMAYYLERQAQAQKNYVMMLIARVVGCCLWCLEKSVKFLNKHAYIQIALMGTSFCTSAWNAFQIIFKNAFTLAFITVLSAIINMIGWVFVTVFTAILGYFIVKGLYPDVSLLVPMLMYIAIGYMVGKLLMNVFTLAVDTSLQCLIATRDMGSTGEEEWIPKPMRNLHYNKKKGGDTS